LSMLRWPIDWFAFSLIRPLREVVMSAESPRLTKSWLRPLLSVLFVFVVFSSSVGATTLTWGTQKRPFEIHRIIEAEIVVEKNGNQKLALARKPYPLSRQDRLESIYLSFDSPLATKGARQQSTGGRILKASYRAVKFDDSVGNAVSFEQPQHELWVAPPEYSFLNQSEHTGDFSIYFMIRPYQLKRKMEIFRKVGLFQGKKQGIYCIWKNGRLVYQFLNLFWHEGVSIRLVEIATKDNLLLNQFQRILLQYRQHNGSLTLFMENVEQEKLYMTDTSKPGGTRLVPRFHPWDRSPMIIGRNYLGALDEMIFKNGIIALSAVAGRYGAVKRIGSRFVQTFGEVTSKRFMLPHSQTDMLRFSYRALEPSATLITIFVRYSDKPFPEGLSTTVLPFKKINATRHEVFREFGGDQIKDQINTYSTKDIGRAKYFQWKAVLYADPGGNTTPVLEGVSLSYVRNPPPQPPRNLEVASVTPNSVKLRFLRNAEMDVIRGGRYHIYYGIKPNQPLGVIRYKAFRRSTMNVKPVPITDADQLQTSDLRYQNRIQIEVTNDMIRENLAYTQSKPRLQYEFPLLQHNIPYYFWVTACDSSFSEKPEHADHESKPSNFVVARPQ